MSGNGHHVEPIRVYLTIFAALMLFTALTVVAAYQNLGPFNNIVAMAIAVTKATLVVFFFMHMRHANSLTKTTILGGIFWLLILFFFTLADFKTRGWLPYPGK